MIEFLTALLKHRNDIGSKASSYCNTLAVGSERFRALSVRGLHGLILRMPAIFAKVQRSGTE